MAIKGFERAGAPVYTRHELDASQAAVLRLPEGESAAVLGAPGSGKTTVAVEAFAERVEVRGYSADQIMVLTQSRSGASRVRDVLALRLGTPTNGPLARTVNSLAFEIVTEAARAAGTPIPDSES